MYDELADYVVTRLRRPVPEGAHVVVGSTPVIAFGNPGRATVATLGLNPSRQEFLDTSGRELNGASRRFETLSSLGVADLARAPATALKRVVEGCDSYFSRNPYKRWFNQLETILRSVESSYYDGTACHLDLVQWATDPVWSKIPDRVARERLLLEDAEFLRQQFTHCQFRLVLINGSGVIRQFEAVMGVALKVVADVAGRSASSRILACRHPSGPTVIAWTINLQSSFGVCSTLRERLASQVQVISERFAE